LKIVVFLILSVFITSCYQEEENSDIYNEYDFNHNNENNTINSGLTNDYKFKEGYIKNNDNVNIYYRLFYKEDNNGLIVLSHKEDSSLEEWGILTDIFLELNYNVISYDLSGFGKTQISENNIISYDNMLNDLKLIVNLAENNDNLYENIVFIGNGLGANISLYVSSNYCNRKSSFIIISPNMEIENVSIEKFSKYCENSKYLFLYSQKSFEDVNEDLYIYNYDNLKTIVDSTSNFSGIDLLLNNSTFIKEIKNLIISK